LKNFFKLFSKNYEKVLDNEQNYDIIMVLRATRKKKDKKTYKIFNLSDLKSINNKRGTNGSQQ
jgi:hypothetical protein